MGFASGRDLWGKCVGRDSAVDRPLCRTSLFSKRWGVTYFLAFLNFLNVLNFFGLFLTFQLSFQKREICLQKWVAAEGMQRYKKGKKGHKNKNHKQKKKMEIHKQKRKYTEV